KRNPAHHLDPARNTDSDITCDDHAVYEMGRLLRRAALAVNGRGAYFVWQSGGKPGHSGCVERLFANLRDAAPNHLFDLTRIDSRPVQNRLLDSAEQLDRMACRKQAIPLPDRRPDRLDDDRSAHPTAS